MPLRIRPTRRSFQGSSALAGGIFKRLDALDELGQPPDEGAGFHVLAVDFSRMAGVGLASLKTGGSAAARREHRLVTDVDVTADAHLASDGDVVPNVGAA